MQVVVQKFWDVAQDSAFLAKAPGAAGVLMPRFNQQDLRGLYLSFLYL